MPEKKSSYSRMASYCDRAMTDASLYRDASVMRGLLSRLSDVTTRPWRIMEVCGGQTFTLSRYRIEELLPGGITMIHGPGCPVCVTPPSVIDAAIELAMLPEVTLCSFGDMLRVPGSDGSLLRAKTAGADVRLLYSPLEALDIARRNPLRQVVFFAIGFETTVPAYALLLRSAREAAVDNLSVVTSLFAVPPTVRAVVDDPDSRVDALLAAGHVCAVTGLKQYRRLAAELRIPIVVTGFEPVDLLLGILRAVEMRERGTTGVSNAYGRVVSEHGSPRALDLIESVFEPCDAHCRGIGVIPSGGLRLRPDYEHFDALRRFGIKQRCIPESRQCIASLIMKGVSAPSRCPAFAAECTPDHPIGAPMVSSEGVCAAHYRYLR